MQDRFKYVDKIKSDVTKINQISEPKVNTFSPLSQTTREET